MRKLFIILLCCTVVGVAGYAGHRSYKVWKQKHLLAMARQFYAKGDAKSAQLSLRQALSVNPMNVEANRLAAEVAQAARSSEALIWRSRVVELNPKSTDDRLALAETAMIYHDYGVGTNALEGVSAEGKKTAAYHNIAGALAAAANQFPEAKAHFQGSDPSRTAKRISSIESRRRRNPRHQRSVRRRGARLLAAFERESDERQSPLPGPP